MDGEGPDVGRRRLLVIGLDGVPPEMLFTEGRAKTPNLSRLVAEGARAPLRTTDPPTSIPAWPVMFTGVDPGTLGVYGFRRRIAGQYLASTVPLSDELPVPTVWEILSRRDYRVAVIGMPLGYPPPHVNGAYIADFLTPPASRDYAYPPPLRDEIESKFGPYTFDVVFRSEERADLLEELVRMTRRRFDVAEWLYDREPWDVFAIHEIGTDRLNHAYWKYFDRAHPKYVPGNPFEDAQVRYWEELDAAIGRLVAKVDESTYVLIVSDHGAMSMNGCFCVNDWLQQTGYLVLRSPPSAASTPLAKADVDWAHTTAWGEGGYFARIHFNVRGREPAGTVPPGRVSGLRRQIVQELSQVRDPTGTPLGVRALDPREIYACVNGLAPDLILYLGELKWRSAGTLGHPALFIDENDIGPDDAVHSLDGVFLLHDPRHPIGRDVPRLTVRDIAPTILELLGEPIPGHIQGTPLRLPMFEDDPRPPSAVPAAPARVPG